MSKALPRKFFNQPTETVAKELLGKLLVRKIGKVEMVGKVVEVEAYLGEDDPAAHAAKGRTKRTAVMYEQPGKAYVYRIHQYHCLNVTAEEEGCPGCVLIRALEPVINIEGSTDGPGRLCRSLAITIEQYGIDMTDHNSELYLADNNHQHTVVTTPRIGISKAVERPLRFFIKDNPYVSR